MTDRLPAVGYIFHKSVPCAKMRHPPGKNQSNTDIFRIGPIPVSPITTRSESARHFDNCKGKSRESLDWLINKGITT